MQYTGKKSAFHFRKIFMKIRDGFNAFIKIGNVKFFVWTVQVIAI